MSQSKTYLDVTTETKVINDTVYVWVKRGDTIIQLFGGDKDGSICISTVSPHRIRVTHRGSDLLVTAPVKNHMKVVA